MREEITKEPAGLHFLKSLDAIHRAIQGAEDLQRMLQDVLDVVLSIFDCDRAFLMFPCDPEAATWQLPMERSRSEYPGVHLPGTELPMDAGTAEILRILQRSEGPVQFGPEALHPLPAEVAENLGITSLLATALYPKVGKPWQLGLHQCSRGRSWTELEIHLFQEIGRRLGDALTGLLAHNNLVESEQRYHRVFENSPVSIWEEDFSQVKAVFDGLRKQGVDDLEAHLEQHPETLQQCAELVKVVDVNRAALKLHGAASKEELLAGLVKTFTLESFDTFRRELVCLWNGGTELVADAVVKTMAGDPRYVTVCFCICPGHEKTFTKIIVSLVDITERKFAEESLRENEQLLKTLINSTPDIICFKDGGGRWLEANTADLELFSLTAVDYRGKTDSELAEYTHPLYREAFLTCESSDERAWQAGKISRGEETIPTADGSSKTFDVIKIPVYEADGSRKGLVVLGRDITERKKAEEQLRQSQKMEAIGQLAGGVAHDFNNMLGVIIGYTELCLGMNRLDEPLREKIRQIEIAAQHSTEVTRQLLAFARKQTIKPEILDLNKSIEGMLKLLRRLIGENIELDCQADGKIWEVKMDPSQLNQILANLCVNAKDAISGFGKIGIELHNIVFDDVSIAAQHELSPGEYVLLAVHDNGKGMDEETITKVFEPFFTTKGLGKGTGLGLSTVYGIVKQNNGSITVDSEPGVGSTFKIYLPRHDDRTGRLSDTASALKRFSGGGETILVVEDESLLLEIIKMMLENHGYNVLVAATPEEAMQLADQNSGKINLLLTDVVMPNMTGQDLVERLRPLYPELKILFMSGYTDDVIMRHGYVEGEVNFIQKPFTTQELIAKVREELSLR